MQAQRLTASRVNRKLTKLGYSMKLRQGRGYCYFEGINPNTNRWDSHSVYTCYVSNLSLDHWIAELEQWIKATAE